MTSRKAMIAIVAAVLMIGAASVAPAGADPADEGPGSYGMGPGMMGPGWYGMGPGMMGPGWYGMGPGMLAPGYWVGPGVPAPDYWMGPGQPGWRAGPGMMGRGYWMAPGYGMIGPGMMGPGMMGPGYGMGPGMMRGGPGWVAPEQPLNLSADDVRSYFQRLLAAGGNQRLKLGKVEVRDDGTIEAQIETVDGSLVASYKVDRRTGAIAPAG
jgi:hypothetical protein